MLYLERQGFHHKYNLESSKDTFLIGRSTANDIQFTSVFVSRRHCEIQRIPPYGRLIIKNCTTTNSTHVDGTELKRNNQVAELRVGSLIGLGVPPSMVREKSNDDRFVYLKVCKQPGNNVIRELIEANSSGILNQSKASTVTANVSQEDIDISSSENISRNDDIEILYAAPITSPEVPQYCVNKDESLFPNIRNTSAAIADALPSSNDGIVVSRETNEKVSIQFDVKTSPESSRLWSDIPGSSTLLPEFNESKQFLKPLREKETIVSPKFKKEPNSFSPSGGEIHKLNNNNANFKEDSSIHDSKYVAKDDRIIRECKLEISGNLDAELEKAIEYEHINGVLIQDKVKTELLSSSSDCANGNAKEEEQKSSPGVDTLTGYLNTNEEKQKSSCTVGLTSAPNTNESTAIDPIIILSDSSSDEEDAVPCNSISQEKSPPKKEARRFYSASHDNKKRESNIDSAPPPKRLKKDRNDAHLLNGDVAGASMIHVTSESKRRSSLSEDAENRTEPTTSLPYRENKTPANEYRVQPTSLESSALAKKCSIQLNRISESRIRGLVQVPFSDSVTKDNKASKAVHKPFDKNNVILDSESDANIDNDSESEMSVDDSDGDNGKENIQNLNLSLESLSLIDEGISGNDVSEKPKSDDIDITKVKSEPLDDLGLRSLFEGDSSDDDDDDIQISYSQVDDVILVSSDDETSFADEPSNASLKNVSFGPLPPSEMECEFPTKIKLENEFDLPDLLADDVKDDEILSSEGNKNSGNEENEEDSDTEWWPFLSQGFDSEEPLDHHKETEMKKGKKTEVEKEKYATDVPSRDLQTIINKISSRHVTKSKFTEPKLPPARKKADEIPRRRSRARKSEQNEVASPKRSRMSEETTDGTHTGSKSLDETLKLSDSSILKRQQFSPSIPKLRNRYRKSPNLRKTIQKTHNLDIYKGKPEKKRHHLIEKSVKDQERLDKPETSNKKENISILPKKKESAAAAKKGIAKISSKSRSEKLTEVDLFSTVSTDTKVKTRSSFRIPKVGNKSDSKSEIKSVDKPTSHSVLNVEKCSRNEYSKDTPIIPNDVRISVTSNDDNALASFSAAHDVVTNEPMEYHTLEPKGILKDVQKRCTVKKRVHFPSQEEKLVAIRPISPRITKNCDGPDVVSLREKYFGQSILKSVISDPLEFILTICNWNWDWLKTYHEAKRSMKNPAPPTLCENPVLPTFTIYKSLNDYQQVFANMLYYEAWETIYKDWEQHMENILFFPCEIDVWEVKVIGRDKPVKYFKVKAFSFITSEMSMHGKHPTSGSLIAMRYKKDNKAVYAFGYVERFSKRNSSCVSEALKKVSPQGANTIILFEIIFSKRHMEADFKAGMMVSCCNVCYFRPTYRAFECLFHLRRSPLLPSILNPGDLSVYASKGGHKGYLVPQLPMNAMQTKSIVDVSRKCMSEFDKPNLSLVHGPPGTGKTRVIAALISQINLMFKNSKHSSNRRIIMCAPSNAAVDELVLRLGKLKEHDILLNIVRVGVKQSIHPGVREFSYDVKVNKEFEKRQFPNDEKIKAELYKKKFFAEQAARDLEKARAEVNPDPENIKRQERRLVELLRSQKGFEDSCRFKLSKRDRNKLFEECKKKVLMTAEIIAATLTSCLSGSLQEVFGKEKSPFACCIVDEAGQCKESEIWFPLQLGIKKLILVGDHLQLPATTLSQLSQGKNLHQSLFERIYHHVGIEKCRLDVIHSLNVQYRMHEDILAWPSMHFYNNDLVAAPNISQMMKHSLCPYLVFDVANGGEEQRHNGEIFNMREALLIRALLESQEKYLQGLTIGVLTPYTRQKLLLIEKLSHLVSKYKITVSTVDNFQGQEKDVIYCTFVRSNASGKIGFVSDRHRLNVALTRAKKSCFVIGDLSSLQSNSDWRSLIKDARQRNLIRNIPPNMRLTDKNSLLKMTLANN